jgi:hypothetical protein
MIGWIIRYSADSCSVSQEAYRNSMALIPSLPYVQYRTSHCSVLDEDESDTSDTSVFQEVNQQVTPYNIHLLSVQHVSK